MEVVVGAAAADTSKQKRWPGRRLLLWRGPRRVLEKAVRHRVPKKVPKALVPVRGSAGVGRSRINAAAGGEENFADSSEMLRIKAGAQAIP